MGRKPHLTLAQEKKMIGPVIPKFLDRRESVRVDVDWMSELSKAATGVRSRRDWESMSQKDIDWWVDFYKREIEKQN